MEKIRKIIKEVVGSIFEEKPSQKNILLNKSFNFTQKDLNLLLFKMKEKSAINNAEIFNIEKDEAIRLLKTNFSIDKNGKVLGYENFPEEISLFRLVRIDNKKNIDKNYFGTHWTTTKEILYDTNFLDSIDIVFYSTEELYIINGTFKKDQIDIRETIMNNIDWENENEISIKKNQNPIKYKIYKY